LAVALLAAPAVADIPPDDACMAADVNEACDNAGEDANQPGICRADTCTRATPDGPMTYECFLCKAATEGNGGADNQGGAKSEGGAQTVGGNKTSGGSPSSAGTKPAADDDAADGDSSCNAAAVPVGGLGGWLVPLVGFGLAAWRRRRARR
jgi:MYXO-CTERM domain-containing protein